MLGTDENDFLVERKPRSQQLVRVGCAGWSIPRDAATHFIFEGSHLERYSRVLNACEINSSFYRPHLNKTWERWASSVPAGFRFSVKAPRTITHEAKLKCTPEELIAFLRQISFLRDNLGPILVQLPPSLEFDCASVGRFFSLLRDNHQGNVVCEPRHRSWFCEPADELLKKFQVARVAADPACVPAAAVPGGYSNLAYFRLHGSPRLYYSAYTENFLSVLATKLTDLPSNTEAWCVFDNTAAGFAIQNALELNAKLRPNSSLGTRA